MLQTFTTDPPIHFMSVLYLLKSWYLTTYNLFLEQLSWHGPDNNTGLNEHLTEGFS